MSTFFVLCRSGISGQSLELLGMVIAAGLALSGGANEKSWFVGENVLMRGDSTSPVSLVNRCRGGNEPRSGTDFGEKMVCVPFLLTSLAGRQPRDR